MGTNLDQLYSGSCLLEAKRCKSFERKLLIVNQVLSNRIGFGDLFKTKLKFLRKFWKICYLTFCGMLFLNFIPKGLGSS